MARFAVEWGNPPAELLVPIMDGTWDGKPHPWHCVACGRRLPRRAAAQCGECAHAWRWGWLLSLADMRARWRAGRALFGLPATPWWHRIRLRRPSRVWICPCCVHDL